MISRASRPGDARRHYAGRTGFSGELASDPSLRPALMPRLRPPVTATRDDSQGSAPRVLMVSYSDAAGGAARAAYRLLRGLRNQGVDARMLAMTTLTGDAAVSASAARLGRVGRPPLDRLPLHLAMRRAPPMFSLAWVPDRLSRKIERLSPGIVHLHWVAAGMLQIESLPRLARPLIWTMHDMWPFTGGCHYDGGCGRFQASCGRCPLLRSSRLWDLSRWVMRRKRSAWRGLPITLVAPSRWLADRARASSLFRDWPVRVIPNGLDLELFQPVDPGLARRLLGLPPARSYLLFGAVNLGGERRKGFELLRAAVQQLAETGWRDRLDLIVAGGSAPDVSRDLSLRVHFLGELRDEVSMALALAAADAVIVPSIQDNLPNMAIEAFACGRPCVGFAVGGLAEIVDDGVNGRLSQPGDVQELALSIAWLLEDDLRRQSLGREARRKAEQSFDIHIVAQRYSELYREVVRSETELHDQGSEGESGEQ
jgi:glycosyltransferase involved in cell wall biosynthesis